MNETGYTTLEQQLLAENAALRQELELLRQQLQALTARVFAPKSERQRTVVKPMTKASQGLPQTGHGPRAQPNLEVVEELCLLDDADLCCPECGLELKPMGKLSQDSEVIDFIPARYVIRRIKRQKYKCTCGHLECALEPQGLKLPADRRYSIAFAAHVAADKYAMHMPLARQVHEMRASGLECDTQTLFDRVSNLATCLKPSYQALRREVLSQPVVGVDESEWKLLNEGTQKWPIWSVRAPSAVFYEIREKKQAADVLALLGDFSGWVVSDGAACFESAEKSPKSKWQAGRCLAHVRRKLVAASKSFPQAQQAVELIAAIYAEEAKIEQVPQGQDAQTWAKERRAEIGHGLSWLEAWAKSIECFPKSSLGEARGFVLSQMPYLKKVEHHPELWLDNNPTERALRGPVLGRKNHYGSKSKHGTEVAAMMYSLVESCKLVGVNPETYLQAAARACALNPKAVTLPRDLLSS